MAKKDLSAPSTNPKVDFYFTKSGKWQAAAEELRKIVLSTGLTEELKWGVPCYTCDGKNVVLIHNFKEYSALLFMKGALLKDPAGILIQQTANVQAGRHIRFTHVSEIIERQRTLKAYIKEAIEVERSGAKVPMKKTSEYKVPEEFQNILDENPKLKKAFEALTPGRQRGYLLYFSQAKLAKTRLDRIKKYTPQILKGKGWND